MKRRTVIEAIEALGLDRNIITQLVEARMQLKVCLGSNLALDLHPSIAEHPVRRLADAGCIIVLGTDDPGFFGTDLATEYGIAVEAHPGLRVEKVSIDAIAAAFCHEQTGAALNCMLEKRSRIYR